MFWAGSGRWEPIKKDDAKMENKGPILLTKYLPDEAAGKYQALYHLMVASSYANKLAHEMIPDVKIGAMLALYGIYPNTCHPERCFRSLSVQTESVVVFGCDDARLLAGLCEEHF